MLLRITLLRLLDRVRFSHNFKLELLELLLLRSVIGMFASVSLLVLEVLGSRTSCQGQPQDFRMLSGKCTISANPDLVALILYGQNNVYRSSCQPCTVA